jgi:type II secretory pathway pseudopilin PulG
MGADRPVWRSEAGVILLERMIAVALAGTIAVATMLLWQKQQETYFRGSEAAQVQQDARAALQVIVRDLRQAKTILTADAGQIVFQSAADADPAPSRTFDLGTVTGCDRLCVRYNRGDGAGSQPIAEGMLALTFAYWDDQNPPNVLTPLPLSVANRLKIRQVDITLQAQMTLTDPDPAFTFSSSVKLRNR